MSFNLTEITGGKIQLAPTKSGWQHGSDDVGYIKTKPINSNLIVMPWRDGQYVTEQVGTSAAFAHDADMYLANHGYNSGFNLQVPAGITQTGATDTGNNGILFKWICYGSIVGIALDMENTNISGNLSLYVDGMYYPVKTSHEWNKIEYMTSINLYDPVGIQVLATDLDYGPHFCELALVSDSSTQQQLAIWGYVVDQSAGYQRPTVQQSFFRQLVALPTSDTAISNAGAPQATKWVRKLCYTNPTASAITVTIKYAGTVIQTVSVPAGNSSAPGYSEIDFGAPTALSISHTHAASAPGLLYSTLGGAI